MTLILLGLDALDHRLVKEFGCETLKLSNYAPLESIAYSMEYPLTTEIWPSVATGLHPREHGITKSGASEWNNPIVAIVSHLLEPLPHDLRVRLGDVAENVFGANYVIQETDQPSIFDGEYRMVHNWPGVHNSYFVQDRWETVGRAAKHQDYTVEQFDREVFPVGAEKFAWVEETLNHNIEIAAVHLHLIDLAGHAYSSQIEEYRRYYEWVDTRVGNLLSRLGPADELLILSDHGMRVSWIDDSDPGLHSSRAFISSTIDNDLPESVLDIRSWVENHIEPVSETNNTKIAVDKGHLEDLGYI